MMSRDVIYEYELLLLGKNKTFPTFYFQASDAQNERVALSVFRYAFDTYLRWTPEQLRFNLTYDIVSMLRLTPLLKYIIYPPEADRSKDMYPIVSKLYPNRFRESARDVVYRVYGKILRGEREKFPKEFFNGTEGKIKALFCFQYMLNNLPPFDSTQEMYKTFSGPSGSDLLRKYKLYAVCSGIFECPLDYLHASLPKAQKNDYYYHYYKFLMKSKKRFLKPV